ncbi:MAG: iron-sulfur cluster assembly accessory protein [Bacteroidia bacterium]
MEQDINNTEVIEGAFSENINDEITLTEKAEKEIMRIINDNNIIDSALRIAVKGGGCSGLSYSLTFDKIIDKKENDKIIKKDDVTIFVDVKSLFYLSGIIVDYTDGLNGTGFTFTNPQASKSCGCGNSFSV